MPWRSPAEERLRSLRRTRTGLRVVLAAFAFVAVVGVVVLVSDPSRWWMWLIVFALSAFLVVRNVQRLRGEWGPRWRGGGVALPSPDAVAHRGTSDGAARTACGRVAYRQVCQWRATGTALVIVVALADRRSHRTAPCLPTRALTVPRGETS